MGTNLFDLSMTDISEGAGVSWNILKKIFPVSLEEKFVAESRKVGRATMYRLDTENPKVSFMVRVHGEADRMHARRKKTSTPRQSA